MKQLYFYPAASEYRALTIEQDDNDGTWSYEWTNRAEDEGFATEAEARAAALEKGQELYPGIVPAVGNENAYGAEWSENAHIN